MTSLSDKLKSLGVKVGASELPSPRRGENFPIERVIEGQFQETPLGQAFVVEGHYPLGQPQGKGKLDLAASLQAIATWAAEPRLLHLDPTEFVFLDTETSGLAGGTGTYAFLIGVGRFKPDGFQLAQYFMRDPLEEPAQLAALIQFMTPCSGLVTFNGKAFDVPLLNTRFITNGEASPLKAAAHIDLLPLARRLWRDRLPSRALGYLEEHILDIRRTQEDVPGWLIPSLYFDYLRSGDARPLKNVFYHNAMDILSLAALLNHVAAILDDPTRADIDHPIDLIAVAKLFADLGFPDTAAALFADGLDHDLPDEIRSMAIQRWSFLEKRRENYALAVELWRTAASSDEIYAFVELAKYYEHHQRDFQQAIHWTQEAMTTLKNPDFSRLERRQWMPELEHRLSRLQGKLRRTKESH
ncbi:MAG TPA: ribonuclease H-like domain-containing protein [Anaerolineales bacterium]|nr:ribonuclease H-like domain-containing protein [Anaerolineales bacterium]